MSKRLCTMIVPAAILGGLIAWACGKDAKDAKAAKAAKEAKEAKTTKAVNGAEKPEAESRTAARKD